MPSEDPGAPAWMMTFGDCMSLLLTFFVMLISFTNFDDAELVEFMSTVKGGFEVSPDVFNEITVYVQPDGSARPVLLAVDEVAEISPLSAAVKKVFKDIIDERYGNKIFFTRTDEGLAIIFDASAVYRKGSVELRSGNRNMFRNIGQLLQDTDNEIRVTVVMPENAEFDPSVSKTPWGFAAQRALVFKDMLREESGLQPERFGVGSHLSASSEELLPEGGQKGFNEYVKILIVDQRQIKEVDAEEMIVDDKWL